MVNQIDLNVESRLSKVEVRMDSQDVRIERQENFQQGLGKEVAALVGVVDKLATNVEQSNQRKFSVTKMLKSLSTLKGIILFSFAVIGVNGIPGFIDLFTG